MVFTCLQPVSCCCSKLVRREAKIKKEMESYEEKDRYVPTSLFEEAVNTGMKIVEASWKQLHDRVVPAKIEPAHIQIERDVVHKLDASGEVLNQLALNFDIKPRLSHAIYIRTRKSMSVCNNM